MAIRQVFLWRPGSFASPGDAVLREDSGYVLRFDGGRILRETALTPSNNVLREDGGYVLRFDGWRITREGEAAPPPSGDALLDVENGAVITDTIGEEILEV